MHRDKRQHKPENRIMEKDNKHEGQVSGCDTAACYAKEISKLRRDNGDLRRLHYLEMNSEKRKHYEKKIRDNIDRIHELEFDPRNR